MAIDVSMRWRARFKHLLSYLLISMLPILLCGMLLILNTYNRRTEQADSSALNGLTLFSSTYSALLGSMNSCAGHLADNLPLYDEKGYESIPSQLSSYQKNYALFTSVLYYEKGSEGIYSSAGYENYHLFELHFSKTYGVDLNMTSLFYSMNAATSNGALRSRALTDTYRDGEYILYLRTVPPLDAKPRGVMVFVISTDALGLLLAECIPPGYALYMYSDQYLTWLFRSDYNAGGALLQERLNKLESTGAFHERVTDQDYILLRAKSETDNMNHMLSYDNARLYESYISERDRSIGILLLLLIPTALIAYALHRTMYTPIDTLLDIPLPDIDEKPLSVEPESLLGDVAQRTRHMIVQNEKLQEQVADQRALLRTQLVMNLIYGGTAYGASASAVAIDLGESPFPHLLYTVVYAETAPTPESPFRHGETHVLSSRDSCLYVIPMRISGQVALLINHAYADRAALGVSAAAALSGLDITPTRMGVGLTQKQKERVPVSLLQAQAVARMSDGSSQIIYFSDDSESPSLTGFLPFSGKMLLCQCIRNGQKEIALSTMHKMRADILPLSGNDAILRSWCFFLFDAVAEALRENNLEELLADLPLDDLLCSPQEAFLPRLEHLVSLACERIGTQDERLLEQKQADMLNYAGEHFFEQSMSLTRLSDEFQLSESYITRFFKQSTGLSFLQYVSQLRLDTVRSQLRETDLPIKDIVNGVGYADIANFTRKFRQIEGCTPGAYRQHYRDV